MSLNSILEQVFRETQEFIEEPEKTLTYTPGVKCLIKNHDCRWLIDYINDTQNDIGATKFDFQVWYVTVNEMGVCKVKVTDGHSPIPLWEDEFHNTSMTDDVKLWVGDGRIMLPSEQ